MRRLQKQIRKHMKHYKGREQSPLRQRGRLPTAARQKHNELQRISRGTRSTKNKSIPLEKSYNPKTTKQLYPWECELKRGFWTKAACGTTGDEVRERIKEGGILHSATLRRPGGHMKGRGNSEMTKSLCFTASCKPVPLTSTTGTVPTWQQQLHPTTPHFHTSS